MQERKRGGCRSSAPLSSRSFGGHPERTVRKRSVILRTRLLSHHLQREGHLDRGLLQRVEAAGGAAVAGFHVGAQQQQVVVGLERAQPRHPFRRLPIGDARVGQAGERQDRRIGLGADVVVGRIGEHRLVIGGALDRIAPFRPFRRRQRQRVVEHGVQHVDEGHVGDEAAEEVGRHVGDGADQHAAGRAALRDDPAARREALGDEMLRGGDEIGEGVGLRRAACRASYQA